jgi:hypothetical protein
MKWSPKKGGSILASWASEQELHYFKVGSDFRPRSLAMHTQNISSSTHHIESRIHEALNVGKKNN